MGVQAQVVTQAGGQYTVQPASAAQGAVQQMKTTYNTGAPLTTAATGSVGQQQPQHAVGGMGQVSVQVFLLDSCLLVPHVCDVSFTGSNGISSRQSYILLIPAVLGL